jgi:hypothetical protein
MFVSTALAANPVDHPPGVDAAHWVPLGQSIGIVLTSDADEAHASKGAPLKPLLLPGDRTVLIAPTSSLVRDAVERAEAREPIHGYLMVKQGGTWRRLIVTSP